MNIGSKLSNFFEKLGKAYGLYYRETGSLSVMF